MNRSVQDIGEESWLFRNSRCMEMSTREAAIIRDAATPRVGTTVYEFLRRRDKRIGFV